MTPTHEQQAIIDDHTGTSLVLASVGSGKTTTLGLRVASLIEAGVAPRRILALTFTNRAAGQLREALGARVPAHAQQVQLSTFHGLCARILREEAETVGLSRDFRIVDDVDAKAILMDLGLKERDAGQLFFQLGAASSGAKAPTLGLWFEGRFHRHPKTSAYVAALTDGDAVDFGGLVLLARALFHDHPDVRARWEGRFDAVMVDEVQDTHLSEYDIVKVLATGSRSLCLVGDLDQTIYGWRGSAPQALIEAAAQDFGPLTKHVLTLNFRATRSLVKLADQLAGDLQSRATHVRAADTLPEGTPPELRGFRTFADEAAWIAERCRHLDTPLEKVAVLTRTGQHGREVAEAMAEIGLPHASAEQFDFFRRTEIKDALALATLVHHRTEPESVRRVFRRLVDGVNTEVLNHIQRAGHPAALRLPDLLDPRALETGDPLGALGGEDLVVLDTETTGLVPGEDEVIEVAAIRLQGGEEVARFEALIRPTRPVGRSEATHGLSDARLAAEGADAATVLDHLGDFVGDTPIAGHNVRFDQRMLETHAARVGVELELHIGLDTLIASRRLLHLPDHRLATVVDHFAIESTPTHRAMDDVVATVALLPHLHALAAPGADTRGAILRLEHARFGRLRASLDLWAARELRPPALIEEVCRRVLIPKLRREPDSRTADCIRNLEELITRMEALDPTHLATPEALVAIQERAALVRSVDALDATPGVRILTMHQSKGLEFDTVFLPGLVDQVLPSWQALREPDGPQLEEERRVLYVAVTRARRSLFLSWHKVGDRGHDRELSSFLQPHFPPSDIPRTGKSG